MRKMSLFLAAGLIAGCMTVPAFAESETEAGKTWVIATDTVFKPFEYTDADGNLMLNNGVEPLNAEGAWIVCGNDADGYRFYNLAAGPQYVLGITGIEASARARLYPIPVSYTHLTLPTILLV